MSKVHPFSLISKTDWEKCCLCQAVTKEMMISPPPNTLHVWFILMTICCLVFTNSKLEHATKKHLTIRVMIVKHTQKCKELALDFFLFKKVEPASELRQAMTF